MWYDEPFPTEDEAAQQQNETRPDESTKREKTRECTDATASRCGIHEIFDVTTSISLDRVKILAVALALWDRMHTSLRCVDHDRADTFPCSRRKQQYRSALGY